MVHFRLGHDEVLPLLRDYGESERLYSGSVGIHSIKVTQPVLWIALIYGESDKPCYQIVFFQIKHKIQKRKINI